MFIGRIFQNPEFKALSDATVKLAMSLPFGILLQMLVRPERRASPRMLTLALVTGMAAFVAAVELGQVLLPSRYPDNTNVLLAVFGVWAGMRFTLQFQRDSAPVARPPRVEPAVQPPGARAELLPRITFRRERLDGPLRRRRR